MTKQNGIGVRKMRRLIYRMKTVRHTLHFSFAGAWNTNFNYRQYLFDAMDGVLGSAELNTAGKAFAKAYYTTDRTKFAKMYGWYLQDYTDFVSKKFGEKYFDNAYFYIENSQENYALIKAIIDRRYEEFLTMKRAKQA